MKKINKLKQIIIINFVCSAIASFHTILASIFSILYESKYIAFDFMINSIALFLMLSSNRRILSHSLCCIKKRYCCDNERMLAAHIVRNSNNNDNVDVNEKKEKSEMSESSLPPLEIRVSNTASEAPITPLPTLAPSPRSNTEYFGSGFPSIPENEIVLSQLHRKCRSLSIVSMDDRQENVCLFSFNSYFYFFFFQNEANSTPIIAENKI